MVTKYVSASGADTNNGNSPDTPYRHPPHSAPATHGFTLSAGDELVFMDGVWGPTTGAAIMDIVNRGTSGGAPILVRVHPGCHARIDNRKFLGGLTWTDQGGGVWSAPFTASAIAAAWAHGHALRKATTQTAPAFGEIGLASNVLYLNLGGNPSGIPDLFGSFDGTTGSSSYAVRVRASHGVTLDGSAGLFEVWGGQSGGVLIFQHSGAAVSYVGATARRLHIAYSDQLLTVQGVGNTDGHAWRDVLIERCDLRTMLTASANPLTGSYSGGDGIRLTAAVRGARIIGNRVENAPHTGLGITPTAVKAQTWLQDILIEGNHITNPELDYGRGLDIRGTGIVVRRNVIEQCKTRTQIAAHNCLIEANVFRDTFGRPAGYSYEISDAVRCQSFGSGTSDWAEIGDTTIINNTIDGAIAMGLTLDAANGIASGAIVAVNNFIRRIEPGTNHESNGRADAVFATQDSGGTFTTLDIRNNLVNDATFYHLGTGYTIDTINAVSGYSGNFDLPPNVTPLGAPLVNSPLLTQGADLGYIRDIRGFQSRKHIGAYGRATMLLQRG